MPTYSFDAIDGPDTSSSSSTLTTSITNSLRLNTADVWAKDLIELTFNTEVLVDPISSSTSSYIIEDLSGNPITIDKVIISNKEQFVTSIFISVKGLTVGTEYIIYADPRIKNYLGNTLQPDYNHRKFFARRTKVDSILANTQKLYDKSATSQFRQLINMIGRQDDLLGGSRSDDL